MPAVRYSSRWLVPRLCRPFAPHGGIHGERLDQRGLRYHSPSLCISVRRVHDIFAIGGATATWYLVSLVVSQLIFHAPELDLMTSQHGSTCLPSLCWLQGHSAQFMVLFHVCRLPMTRHWLSTRIEAGHHWIFDHKSFGFKLLTRWWLLKASHANPLFAVDRTPSTWCTRWSLQRSWANLLLWRPIRIWTIQFRNNCHSRCTITIHNIRLMDTWDVKNNSRWTSAGFLPSTVSLQSAFAQVWKSASELATAYEIGDRESGAALNLLQRMDQPVVDALSRLVKTLVCQLLLLILRLWLRNELDNVICAIY